MQFKIKTHDVGVTIVTNVIVVVEIRLFYYRHRFMTPRLFEGG